MLKEKKNWKRLKSLKPYSYLSMVSPNYWKKGAMRTDPLKRVGKRMLRL